MEVKPTVGGVPEVRLTKSEQNSLGKTVIILRQLNSVRPDYRSDEEPDLSLDQLSDAIIEASHTFHRYPAPKNNE